MSKYLYIFSLVLIIPVILCDTNFPCSLNDGSCHTAAHKLLVKLLMAGNPALNILSSDPLHNDKIQVTLPNMAMTLTNANMYGTQACDIDQVKLGANTWYFSMICPKLTLISDYEMNGFVDSILMEGKGTCKIIYDNYSIGVSGGHDTNTGNYGKGYFNIISYKTDLIDVQRVTYNFTNLFYGDNEKSMKVHQYINTNWRKLHDTIGEPIIYNLMGYFINNFNKFLALVPSAEIFNIPMFFKNIPFIPKPNIPNIPNIPKNPFNSFL